MKTQLAISRELQRVRKAKELRAKQQDPSAPTDFRSLFGAEQALAWALDQNAMAPAKCFAPVTGR